jgi:hypothetical protein
MALPQPARRTRLPYLPCDLRMLTGKGKMEIPGHASAQTTSCYASRWTAKPAHALMAEDSMDVLKDEPSRLYDVARETYHASRPGFRIAELTINPTQKVPWHCHSNFPRCVASPSR